MRLLEEVLNYPTITVSKELEFKIKNGCKIKDEWQVKEKVFFQNEDHQLLGIYEKEEEYLKVWKNM